jgi:hypothetical protein
MTGGFVRCFFCLNQFEEVRFASSNENSPVARTTSESAWVRISSRIQHNVASRWPCVDGYYAYAWSVGVGVDGVRSGLGEHPGFVSDFLP